MRKRLLVVLLALGLATAAPGSAVAGEQWCETDPLVVVRTPRGALVPVYVTNGAMGVQYLALAQLAEIAYETAAVEGGTATLVRMTVTVPPGPGGTRFETRSVVSTGPLKTETILAWAQGWSGQAMRMEFKLATP